MTHARFTTRAHHRTRVLENAHRCSKTRTGARTRARALEHAHLKSTRPHLETTSKTTRSAGATHMAKPHLQYARAHS